MNRRVKILLCVGAALAALAPHAGSSMAAFTSAATNPGNSVAAGSLTPVSDVAAAQPGPACAASSITVSWTAGGGLADQSMVERSVDAGAWTTVATTTTTSWTEPDAFADGTALSYRVRSKLSGAGTWDTAPVSAGTVRCGFVVTGLAATNPCSQVNLSWSAPAGGAASYDVEVEASGSWTRLATAQAAASYVDTTARPASGATYRVRARHSDGTIGFWTTTTLASWSDFRLVGVRFEALSNGATGAVRTGDTAVFTFSKPAATTSPATGSSASASVTNTSIAFASVGGVGGPGLFSGSGSVPGDYSWNAAGTALTWRASANTTVTQARALAADDTFSASSPSVTCAAVAGAAMQAPVTATIAGRF